MKLKYDSAENLCFLFRNDAFHPKFKYFQSKIGLFYLENPYPITANTLYVQL